MEVSAHSAVQECDDLPAGTGCGGRELAAAGAAGDLLIYSPRYRLRVVRIGGNIGKAGLLRRRRATGQLPEVFHGHGAGTVGISAEGGTGHQALFSGPQSRFIEVVGGFNIREGVSRGRLWRAVRAPQEGQNLRLTASCARRKFAVTGAAGDLLIHSPLNRVRKVVAGLSSVKLPMVRVDAETVKPARARLSTLTVTLGIWSGNAWTGTLLPERASFR